MLIRNGTYTWFKDVQFEISKDPASGYNLIYKGMACPIRDICYFRGTDGEGFQVYQLTKSQTDEIVNCFDVRTYLIWKGQVFETDKYRDGRFRVWTENRDFAYQGKMEIVERGVFMKWIPRTEIICLWEKRSNSRHLDLPFPEKLANVEGINFLEGWEPIR